MINLANQLKRSLTQIQALILIQRAVQLVLRAAWLGVAGYLIGWAINHFWGVLPDTRFWLGIGGVLSLATIAGFFITWSATKRLVWKLDRQFNLKEQISTAWSLVSKGQQPARLGDLLISDALPLLGEVRKQIFRHGWFLLRDFVSILIVFLAGISVLYPSTQKAVNIAIPEQRQPVSLVGISSDPSYQAVLPEGVFSLDTTAQQAGTGTNSQSNNSADSQALANALKKLGDELSQQAITQSLGRDLQNLDLNSAAETLDALAAMVPSMPQSSKDQVAQALQAAAASLEQSIPDSALAKDLRKAADSLSSDQNASQGNGANDAISQVATDLRQASQDLQNSQGNSANASGNSPSDQPGGDSKQGPPAAGAGTGHSNAQQGPSAPMPRLDAQGGTLELPTSEPPSAASVLTNQTPNDASQTSGSPTSGSGTDASTGSSVPVQGSIFPYYYSWDWRNVIAQYFQRTQ